MVGAIQNFVHSIPGEELGVDCVSRILGHAAAECSCRPRFYRTIARILGSVRPTIREGPRCRGTTLLRELITPRGTAMFEIP